MYVQGVKSNMKNNKNEYAPKRKQFRLKWKTIKQIDEIVDSGIATTDTDAVVQAIDLLHQKIRSGEYPQGRTIELK
jgi:hypothetical protein